MSINWRQLSRHPDFAVTSSEISVTFAEGRSQRVRVGDENDATGLIRLWSVVVRSSALPTDEDPHLLAWQRNRASDLVGFKIDGRGRLIGEAWVPVAGLDAEEWAVYVRTVARACDRLEYLLTGRDES